MPRETPDRAAAPALGPGPDVSRRQVLRQLALAVTAAGSGVFTLEAGRVVHALAGEASQQAGGYAPALFSGDEFATLTRLAELPLDRAGRRGRRQRGRCGGPRVHRPAVQPE